MVKSSHLSHGIIMQTAKLHVTLAHNLGACAGETDPGLKSPEIKKQITEQWIGATFGDWRWRQSCRLHVAPPQIQLKVPSTQCEIDRRAFSTTLLYMVKPSAQRHIYAFSFA